MNVAEWADTYGIHQWRILLSSYRKLAWVGFEPTTTEFCSGAMYTFFFIIFRTRMINLTRIRIFSEKVALYFWYSYCPTALLKIWRKWLERISIKSKTCKIHLLICSQTNGQRDWEWERKKFGGGPF